MAVNTYLTHLHVCNHIVRNFWPCNQGTIELTKNPKFHNPKKHIDIAYHYAKEQVEKRITFVKYCRTEDMLADTMMMALFKVQFEKFRDTLGVIKMK